jgi:hypothetical protein
VTGTHKERERERERERKRCLCCVSMELCRSARLTSAPEERPEKDESRLARLADDDASTRTADLDMITVSGSKGGELSFALADE